MGTSELQGSGGVDDVGARSHRRTEREDGGVEEGGEEDDDCGGDADGSEPVQVRSTGLMSRRGVMCQMLIMHLAWPLMRGVCSLSGRKS